MSTNDERLAADVALFRKYGGSDKACAISELEKQLRVRDEALEVLANENAMLSDAKTWIQASEIGSKAAEKADLSGAAENDALLAGMNAIIDSIKTPGTKLYLRCVRAEGLELAAEEVARAGLDMFARELRQKAEQLRAGEDY